MDEFITIFEISKNTNGYLFDALLRISIGIIALVIGVVGLIRWKQGNHKFPKKIFRPAFITFWGAIWLFAHIHLLQSGDLGTSWAKELINAYENGHCKITEGIVHVRHEQPVTGHDAGDEICIDDQTFFVSSFLITPAYAKGIANGGVLKEGVYARLHHYRGKILKVEIKQK